ncbi:MAG: hypothetical protein AAF992_20770 [Bacteroidota bacterium]
MRFNYLLFFFLSMPFLAGAQDTHYWTQQYGTRSALMGGAVVAGASDNSTVYYNPGGLGFIDETTLSVNANLYRIENIQIENAIGQRADFRSSSFGSVPILVGGMFNVKSQDWKVGYSLIAPVDFRFQGNARVDGDFLLVDDSESPGREAVVGEADKTSELSEVTAAIGVGRRLNEYWSVGLTSLFNLRSLEYQRQLLVHMILNDAPQTPVNTTFLQYAKYFNVRYAAKVGVSYQRNQWAAGLTLTSPSLNVMGSGTLSSDITVQNLRLEETGRVDGFANDRQEKLKTNVKSPFTIAGGVQYRFARSLLAFSAQYFGSVDPYAIIQAEEAAFVRYGEVGSNLGSQDLLIIRGGARSVLNAVLGYERNLNEQLTMNLSFRNDMSYLDPSLVEEQGFTTNISSWDIYHLTGGVTIHRNRSSMSLGLLLSNGSNGEHTETGSINNANEADLIRGVTKITRARYTSVGLLLGFTFNFKKFE